MDNQLKPIRVLVLGVGGNVSQGIIKALRESEIPMRIIGACINEFSKGLYMCDEGYLCPFASDERFLPWVINFCNEHKVDIIFTGVEENIIQLAKSADLIKKQTNTIFVSSSYEKLLIGQDKYLTCKFLQASGCNYPLFQLWTDARAGMEFAEKVGFPIIAKPRNGKSSKGIVVLKTKEDLAHQNFENYVLEQYIGNDSTEYTVGCYVDKQGNLIKMIPMARRLHNGTTVWAKTIVSKAIENECAKICNAFKPQGPLNIQLRTDGSGNPVCFELNVRFSGTTAIRSHFGFKDVKAMLLEYVYRKPFDGCFNLKQGEVFRFDEEFYLDCGATQTMSEKRFIGNIDAFLWSKKGNKL